MTTLLKLLSTAPVATILVVIITIIVGLVGGVVTITDAERLSFEAYVAVMTGLAGSNALLGLARGIRLQNQPVTEPDGLPTKRRRRRA